MVAWTDSNPAKQQTSERSTTQSADHFIPSFDAVVCLLHVVRSGIEVDSGHQQPKHKLDRVLLSPFTQRRLLTINQGSNTPHTPNLVKNQQLFRSRLTFTACRSFIDSTIRSKVSRNHSAQTYSTVSEMSSNQTSSADNDSSRRSSYAFNRASSPSLPSQSPSPSEPKFRVPSSGSIKDRIAKFNNPDAAPLVPRAAFGSAPPAPKSGPSSQRGLIGNRIPSYNAKNVGAEGVFGQGRKGEAGSKELYGNRIPGLNRYNLGVGSGTTGTGASTEEGESSVPEPKSARGSFDLKAGEAATENVDLTETPPAEDNTSIPSITTSATSPNLPADLAPSTYPNMNLESGAATPKSTAVEPSEMSGSAVDTDSIPPLSRMPSNISLRTDISGKESVARSMVTEPSSLRVELDASSEEGSGALDGGPGGHAHDLSEVSTPTGTPTLGARDSMAVGGSDAGLDMVPPLDGRDETIKTPLAEKDLPWDSKGEIGDKTITDDDEEKPDSANPVERGAHQELTKENLEELDAETANLPASAVPAVEETKPTVSGGEAGEHHYPNADDLRASGSTEPVVEIEQAEETAVIMEPGADDHHIPGGAAPQVEITTADNSQTENEVAIDPDFLPDQTLTPTPSTIKQIVPDQPDEVKGPESQDQGDDAKSAFRAASATSGERAPLDLTQGETTTPDEAATKQALEEASGPVVNEVAEKTAVEELGEVRPADVDQKTEEETEEEEKAVSPVAVHSLEAVADVAQEKGKVDIELTSNAAPAPVLQLDSASVQVEQQLKAEGKEKQVEEADQVVPDLPSVPTWEPEGSVSAGVSGTATPADNERTPAFPAVPKDEVLNSPNSKVRVEVALSPSRRKSDVHDKPKLGEGNGAGGEEAVEADDPSQMNPTEFYGRFQQDKSKISEMLASAPRSDQNISEAVTLLASMKRSLTIANDVLPAYDKRRYQEQIKGLEDTLNGVRGQAKPKFSFKKTSSPSPAASPVEEEDIADASRIDDHGPEENLSFTLGNMRDQYARLPRDQGKSESAGSLNLHDVDSSIVDLHSEPLLPGLTQERSSNPTKLSSVFVNGMSNTAVFVDRVQGSMFVSKVQNSLIVAACQQFRMHDSQNCTVLLSTPSRPVIEQCTDIRFSEYPDELVDEAEDQAPSLHHAVQDFDWIKDEPSPNWSRAKPIRWPIPTLSHATNLDITRKNILQQYMRVRTASSGSNATKSHTNFMDEDEGEAGWARVLTPSNR